MAGQSHPHVQQVLCADLGQLVHRGEAGLEEAVLVALHLDSPEPLSDGGAGRGGERRALVEQGVGRPRSLLGDYFE